MSENNKIIRFIDSDYRELFCIPDGGSIKITYPAIDGRAPITRVCKYRDDYHFETLGKGGDMYHICQFAEIMERLGARYEPDTQLRNAEFKPFTPGEEKFCIYNRDDGNACIGHFAGDFGRQSDRFSAHWSGRDKRRDTSKFQTELHSAVYLLRQYLLKNRDTMLEYCKSHSEAKLPDSGKYEIYGFKLETAKRSYFVNCFAERDNSRFTIYAYDTAALMRKREQEAVASESPFAPMGDWAMAKDYNGAEPFKDNSRPLIAQAKFADVIISGILNKDEVDISVHPYGKMCDCFYDGTVKTKELAIQIGKNIAKYIDTNTEAQFADGSFKQFFAGLQIADIRMNDLSQAPVYSILPANADESKMFYRNDEEANLCIGYLRGDHGKNGGEFHHNWFENSGGRKTPEFQAEFQAVMDTLRQEVLKDLKSTQDFCYKHPGAQLPGDVHRYGFKLETETRSYFIRCTVLRDDYFYVYAYDKAAVREQERSAAEKPSVLKQLREAQKAPKPPRKEKSPDKQKGGAEL